MDMRRKRMQGTLNILYFNIEFYLCFIVLILILYTATHYIVESKRWIVYLIIISASLATLLSLFVSYYIYDYSNFYTLPWVKENKASSTVLNITAGFDETTPILTHKYKNAQILSLDFYDGERHTEPSIKRARKLYPPSKNVVKITTSHLPYATNSINDIYLIFSAHEIRDPQERVIFFNEIQRVLTVQGQVTIVEHLRDIPNFIAYTLGFLHFHSKSTWENLFLSTNFFIKAEQKHTPFVSIYTLTTNGVSS
jgi:ubiquinone/menaquinone biosynthesis C-methylase UbiE